MLMKASSKRRRTKCEIEDDRRHEAKKAAEVRERLA